ncbi:MAG TPA: hypothetical protein VNJ08_06000 [Bacteriovoracaceae bacterium]|nr:hypothetical protein [Bacteriovoracaceae bacterium]
MGSLTPKLLFLLMFALLAGCQDTKTTGESNAQSNVLADSNAFIKKPAFFAITTVTSGNGSAVITFTSSAQAELYTVSYRPITSAVNTLASTISTGSPHTLTGLTNGITYVVKVTAINDVGATDSNTVHVIPKGTVAVGPVSSNLAVTASEDIEKLITLPYVDSNGDLADLCASSSLSNITVTRPCVCTDGQCQIGVRGTANFSGTGSFQFTVTANGATSALAIITLAISAVDDAPVAAAIVPMAFNEDTQSIITLSYTDTESNLATTCSLSALTNVTVTRACQCSIGICTVGVTGTANFFGSASFAYTVTANGAVSNAANAALTITDVDDLANAMGLTPVTFPEDTQSIINLGYTDIEGVAASACTLSNLANVTVTTPCTCPAGVCSVGVTGNTNYNGVASFTYTVTVSGVPSNPAIARFSIYAVDDSPVTADSAATFNEDTETIIPLPYLDVDGHSATACTLADASNITFNSACTCLNGSCSVVVKGTVDYFGAASFSYTVTTNGTVSNSSVVSLTVTAVDDRPIATTVTPTNFNEDTATLILLSSTDIEGDAATACTVDNLVKLSIVTPCTCPLGICSVVVQGETNYSGAASFRFSVTRGGKVSFAASAAFTIDPVDDAPVTNNIIGNLSVYEDVKKVIPLPYTDAEGDLATSCTISAGFVAPVNVTVTSACSCSAGACSVEVLGTPNFFSSAPQTAGETWASFFYTITAGAQTSIQKYAFFPVLAMDDAPVATPTTKAYLVADTAVDVILPYTDPDGPGDLATGCAITSTTNAMAAGPCVCSGGVCSVPMIARSPIPGETRSANPAYFQFTVTSKTLTSLPAQASGDCPTGYLRVPADTLWAVGEFCVMKYEAKVLVGDPNPVSRANGVPHGNITHENALNECRDIDGSSTNYDLISNDEWMSIARNIESETNWHDFTSWDPSGTYLKPGTSCLSRGNTYHNTDYCSSSWYHETYDGDIAGEVRHGPIRNTMESFTLSNGQVIWDFAGNVSEWITWFANPTYSLTTNLNFLRDTYGECYSTTVINGISCNRRNFGIGSFKTLSPHLITNAHGTGTFMGAGVFNSLIRGGDYMSSSHTGIYALSIINPATTSVPHVGYRCVYRP